MGLLRNALLLGSQSRWLREHATRSRLVRSSVARFMPGETLDDALAAAAVLEQESIGTVFTHLGENISDASEAEHVTGHYLEVLDRVHQSGLGTEVSVKLTQLGLDFDRALCYSNVARIIEREKPPRVVWIDMEATPYVDVTLELFRRARQSYPNVGLCLQAYLYRTADDLAALVSMGAAVRLVKGAYKEPASLAFPRKQDVDRNYLELARTLLSEKARQAGVRAAFATHDGDLIRRILAEARGRGLSARAFEFQMLYGIQRAEQLRLAQEGWRSVVLIAYGSYWFPWYMRRLAERPANLWFFARNFFGK